MGSVVEFLHLHSNQKKLIHRQISNHTLSGGKLKVGSSPMDNRNAAAGLSSSRVGADPRRVPNRQEAFGSSDRSWAIAAVAVVVVTALLILVL